MEFPLNFSKEKKQVRDAILGIQKSGSKSHVEKALKQLREGTFKECVGARGSAPDVAIVFTDGKFTNETAARYEADMAANAGIRVYSVGIGSTVKTSGLSVLSSPHTGAFTYSAPQITDIGKIRSRLVTRICKGILFYAQ